MAGRSEYTCVVKKYAPHGIPWIAFEPVHSIELFENRKLGIDLKSGTTVKEAEELAELLNRRMGSLRLGTSHDEF